jgi:malonate-semialdehyde dehydrogenase (acetylating)/methylmalonate-semialdehyde dehydrogenase
LADRAETEAADAAHTQPEWADWGPQLRARVLMRFLQIVEGERDSLARLLSSEHGKTVADAHDDLQRGLEAVEFAVGSPHLLRGEFSDSAGAVDVHSARKPLGVIAGVTPFDFPAMIPLWQAALPTLRLAEIFAEAGLPLGVLNVVNGGEEAVDTLLGDPRVQAVEFVGSAVIAEYACSTADKGAQCFGGVKSSDADVLVAKLTEGIADLEMGTSNDFGPLVGADALARVSDYIEVGVAEDGQGLRVPGHEGRFFLGACLFDQVTPDMRTYREEIFGPVLSVGFVHEKRPR